MVCLTLFYKVILVRFHVNKELMQVYSHHSCEKTPDRKGVLNCAKDLLRWGTHRSNYDWMLFLTSPMAYAGDRSGFAKVMVKLLVIYISY